MKIFFFCQTLDLVLKRKKKALLLETEQCHWFIDKLSK